MSNITLIVTLVLIGLLLLVVFVVRCLYMRALKKKKDILNSDISSTCRTYVTNSLPLSKSSNSSHGSWPRSKDKPQQHVSSVDMNWAQRSGDHDQEACTPETNELSEYKKLSSFG